MEREGVWRGWQRALAQGGNVCYLQTAGLPGSLLWRLLFASPHHSGLGSGNSKKLGLQLRDALGHGLDTPEVAKWDLDDISVYFDQRQGWSENITFLYSHLPWEWFLGRNDQIFPFFYFCCRDGASTREFVWIREGLDLMTMDVTYVFCSSWNWWSWVASGHIGVLFGLYSVSQEFQFAVNIEMSSDSIFLSQKIWYLRPWISVWPRLSRAKCGFPFEWRVSSLVRHALHHFLCVWSASFIYGTYLALLRHLNLLHTIRKLILKIRLIWFEAIQQ